MKIRTLLMASAAASLLAGTAQAQSLSQTFLNVQDADNYTFSPGNNNDIAQSAANIANLIDKPHDDFNSLTQTFGTNGNPANQDAYNELSTVFGSYRDFEQVATNAGSLITVDDVSSTVTQTAVGRQDADNVTSMRNSWAWPDEIDSSQTAANVVNTLSADQVGADVGQSAKVNQDADNYLSFTSDPFNGANLGNEYSDGDLVPDQVASNSANLVDIEDLTASSSGIDQRFVGSSGQFARNRIDAGAGTADVWNNQFGTSAEYDSWLENTQQLAANAANIVNVDDLADGITQGATAPQTALNEASFGGYFAPSDGSSEDVGQTAQNSLNIVSADDLLNNSADVTQASNSTQLARNTLSQVSGDNGGRVVDHTEQLAVNTANLVQFDNLAGGSAIGQTAGAAAVQTSANTLSVTAGSVGNLAQTAGNYSNLIIDPPSN